MADDKKTYEDTNYESECAMAMNQANKCWVKVPTWKTHNQRIEEVKEMITELSKETKEMITELSKETIEKDAAISEQIKEMRNEQNEVTKTLRNEQNEVTNTLRNEIEGNVNVLNARIATLEKTVAELTSVITAT